MSQILIVEDDDDINQLLQTLLKKEGYLVSAAFSGTEGALHIQMEKFDLLICDLMLPGMSGEELIQKVRATHKFPIIALSAKGGLDDKVHVLELGADDYMTKPFEAKELLARVKAQLRRSGFGDTKSEQKEDQLLQIKQLILNAETLTAEVEGTSLELTVREFEILKIMMQYPQKVFSKEALYEAVWKDGYYGEDNTISVHVSNIRKKIEKITAEEYISTVWGIGYRLKL
jgi:DNA-binding response OmpR family regulator